MTGSLSIGQLADAEGVSVSAIRYYEERNLVTPTGRVGDKRRFDQLAVDRLAFIKRAQVGGFSLDEIKVLLDDGAGESRELLKERLEALRQSRAELDRTIAFLEQAAHCGCTNVAQCQRVIDA